MAAAVVLSDHYSNSSNCEGGEEIDRLSQLPDDVLLLVLDKLRSDVRLLARTSVLSKRWRTLPLTLSRIVISVPSLIDRRLAAATNPPGIMTVRHVYQGTAELTDALRFFLANSAAGEPRPRSSSTIMIDTLFLRFPLTKHRGRLDEIVGLVGGAVARGEIRSLEVVLDTVMDPHSARYQRDADAVARVYARRFTRLAASPAGLLASSCLRLLVLKRLCFDRQADLWAAVGACVALETLHLHRCWFAPSAVLTVDAPPASRLRELRIVGCYVEGIRVVRAPELFDLRCDTWPCAASPLAFSGPAAAPSLKRLALTNRAQAPGQRSFKLSELLENAAGSPCLEQLHLDFVAGKVWVQPEGPRRGNLLRAAFAGLKTLSLWGMSPHIDMSWTMFLLEAAPLLELLEVLVTHHDCCEDDDDVLDEDLFWDLSDGFEHRHLHTFQIRGDVDPEGDLKFLRLVVERAVNRNLLLLMATKVKRTCQSCVAAARQQQHPPLSKFPSDKDDVDEFVRELKDGLTTQARIVIASSSAKQVFEY